MSNKEAFIAGVCGFFVALTLAVIVYAIGNEIYREGWMAGERKCLVERAR
jgi:predicted PurR-regulated permease PerM